MLVRRHHSQAESRAWIKVSTVTIIVSEDLMVALYRMMLTGKVKSAIKLGFKDLTKADLKRLVFIFVGIVQLIHRNKFAEHLSRGSN